ncbi:MAG TPA: DUF5060 domain-containing protein [Bryobacteraceae bacterium]|jgi:hypothetical protein|nr:DUF5060 domain-containing protein [Bryobacteraceae bacterium]
MQRKAVCRMALIVLFPASLASAAPLPSCAQSARAFAPCELSFDWQTSEVPKGLSPYKDELLNIEFRSPRHVTYLMHAFWDGGQRLRVRFSPTEPGAWTYHVTSEIKRYDNQESTFTVGETNNPGFVSVANVRHWRTSNKQPHLWLAVSVPFLEVETPALETWLDARKKDGFTHVRGSVLTLGSALKPLSGDGQPNFAYFAALDERILAADTRGFTVDLLLADDSFVKSGTLSQWEQRDPLMRYLIARYAGLNVTWQGIQHFEDTPDARALLKDLNAALQKYDAFQHPRSTDARVTSSPLLGDGWMNYMIESSPHPELAAVEHQFTQAPEIHAITATDPDTFRHELWNSTTNGEYPSISYEAMRNDANVHAVRTWVMVVSDTRHWELEPYFDVDGARAVGLQEVEYLAYAETPGIVEVTLPKHKYNPVWVNPSNGEEIPLKDYKGEVFSRQTPDAAHDWVLTVPREGHKESMLRSYYFESQNPPIQEPELDDSKIPFTIAEPEGNELNRLIPVPYQVKITRPNRATRRMQYVWWGEIVASGEGGRVLGVGSSGNLNVAEHLTCPPGSNLTMRLLAINANGKAYEVDRVYRLTP